MTLLDELSGFEFEEVMVEVFHHQGYSDVERAELIADEGRDVTMIDDRGIEGDTGTAGATAGTADRPTAVVVECKHTGVVSRPVVQKTHSAAHTYDCDGPVRAMIATTGRFTDPAREYAAAVDCDPDDVEFALLDGEDLRDLSEEIPLDRFNGTVEIVCEEAIAPPTDRETLESHLEAAAADVRNLDEWTVGATLTAVRFEPVLFAETSVDASFETDVGEIHAIQDRERLLVDGHADDPERCAQPVADLVERTRSDRLSLDDHALDGTFDRIDIERFAHDERGYRAWLAEVLADRHEEIVSYTGDNGVEYERTCRPSEGDVAVESLEPVYLPHVAVATSLGQYEYELELYAAGGETLVRDAEFDRCVHCETDRGDDGGANGDGTHPADVAGDAPDDRPVSLTYCANCGAIACPEHVETERLVGEPVCTGCAVTGRFAGATRYFYDETNRETFAKAFAEMPLYRRIRENDGLVALLALVAFLLAVAAFGLL